MDLVRRKVKDSQRLAPRPPHLASGQRRRLLLGALALVLLLVCAWGCRVGWLALALRGRVVRLQQAAAEPQQANLKNLAAEVHGAHQELQALRDTMQPAIWLGGWLGGDARAVGPLLDSAVESSAAGDEALQALASSLGDLAPGSL